MATIARLTVDMDLNNHQLKRKLEESKNKTKGVLERMDKDFGKFAKGVHKKMNQIAGKIGSTFKNIAALAAKIGAKIALAGTALVGSLIAVVTSSLSAIDKQERLAKSLGITGDAFREMSYAAKQYGLDQDRIVDGMKELNLKVTEYLEVGSGAGVDFFARAGVNVKEFIGLNPAEQLEKFADVIKTLPDDEIRFFADELGSDALYEMIPLLKQGSGHIQELRKEARLLGLNLGDSATNASVAMQSIRRVGTSLQGVAYQASISLAPAMAAVFDTIIDRIKAFAKSVGGFDKVGQIIANSVITAMSSALRSMDSLFNAASANFRSLARTYNSLPFVSDENKIQLEDKSKKPESQKLTNLRAKQSGLNSELKDLMDANTATRGQAAGYYVKLIEEKNKELHAIQEQIHSEIQRPAVSTLESLAQELDSLKPEILNRSDKIMDGILVSEFKGQTKLTQQFKGYNEKRLKLANDYESFKRSLQIQSFEVDDQYLEAQSLKEQDRHATQLEELRSFLNEKYITQEEYKLQEQELERVHQETLAQIREDAAERERDKREAMQSELLQAIQTGEWSKVKMNEVTQEDMKQATIKGGKAVLGELGKQNKKAFELNKLFNIGEAIMNTATGVSKALAQGGMWGIPMAAVIGAMGAVQISTIASQQYQGQAHAGINSVPGSGDQTWMLKGGERVVQPQANADLTNYLKNNQAKNAQAGGDNSVHVTNVFEGGISDQDKFNEMIMNSKETVVSAYQEVAFYRGV